MLSERMATNATDVTIKLGVRGRKLKSRNKMIRLMETAVKRATTSSTIFCLFLARRNRTRPPDAKETR
jgi:hypothetical protein